MSFWNKILGFQPEKELEIKLVEKKCYKCGSINVDSLGHGSWSEKYKCNNCGYFTYVIYVDRMGGGATDSVAIDEKNSDLFL